MDIRSLVAGRMHELGMSPCFLAKRLGLSPQTVKGFIAGKHEIGHRKLEKIMLELDLCITEDDGNDKEF